MSAIDFWVAEHRARAPRLPGAALPWLAGLRERAIQRFADEGWPTPRIENWHHTSLAFMEQRAAAIRAGEAKECVWLVEHPPLFTAGTSADPAELTNPLNLPVYEAGRGGRYTYHGPGQRVRRARLARTWC